ncbi:hypothetical protein AJ79_10338 [Helicocarpus griseus UAMH5409]|uniref:Uncharacterized protein n=1 Tax=Helicocarpus griseus UAMH5409 TaxID=1447875 RepID=A0A2B7WEE2_9EURO|nr:hypothetical protein AJ79_10338 [Helicocarpus griseus UAMH5409]
MALCETGPGSDFLNILQDDAWFAECVCLQIQSLVSQLHHRGDCQPFFLGSQLRQLANGIKHIAEQYARDHISYSYKETDFSDEFWISDFSPTPQSNKSILWTSDLPSYLDMTCALSDLMPPPFNPTEHCYGSGNAASPDPLVMNNSAEDCDELPTTQNGNTCDNGTATQEDCAPEQPNTPPKVSSSDYAQMALALCPGSALTSKMARNNMERITADESVVLPRKSKRKNSLGFKVDGETSQPQKRRLKASTEASQSLNTLEQCIELTPMSNSILKPSEVYHILLRQSETKHHQKVPFLVRLFFAIASPLAFEQLAEACKVAAQQSPGELTRGTELSGRADSSTFQDLLINFYPHLKVPDRKNPLADDSEYYEKHTKLKNQLNSAHN